VSRQRIPIGVAAVTLIACIHISKKGESMKVVIPKAASGVPVFCTPREMHDDHPELAFLNVASLSRDVIPLVIINSIISSTSALHDRISGISKFSINLFFRPQLSLLETHPIDHPANTPYLDRNIITILQELLRLHKKGNSTRGARHDQRSLL
jgi:hypothetical protein